MATNDKTSTEDEPLEGSWSPRRPKGSSAKAARAAKSSSDTEALTQEIEHAREELAETLDAIADRVSPKKVVGRTKKAAKDGATDAVDAVKETAVAAAESVKGGVAAVKEKVSGESSSAPAAVPAAAAAEIGPSSPLPADTVSLPGAEVPLEPAPTPRALADAATTVTEPAGGETPAYVAPLPPAPPSRLPALAGAGAALLALLLLLRRRRR